MLTLFSFNHDIFFLFPYLIFYLIASPLILSFRSHDGDNTFIRPQYLNIELKAVQTRQSMRHVGDPVHVVGQTVEDLYQRRHALVHSLHLPHTLDIFGLQPTDPAFQLIVDLVRQLIPQRQVKI